MGLQHQDKAALGGSVIKIIIITLWGEKCGHTITTCYGCTSKYGHKKSIIIIKSPVPAVLAAAPV